MANHRVAWVLLVSYVALLAFSSYGIGVSFMLAKKPKPAPPDVNLTTPDEVEYIGQGSINNSVKSALQEFARATEMHSNYNYDAQVYLVVPCGLSILIIIPIILGGLCSRKLFSTSIGLYSSVVLWSVNLGGMILYQNGYFYGGTDDIFYNCFGIILGVQLGMLAILTPQIITAAWELRRQKTEWPVLHISRLFTFNTAFLVGRIVAGIYLIDEYRYSRMWRGFEDRVYSDFYSFHNIWMNARVKCPEYYVYPICIAVLYGVLVPMESLLSHLFGHLHTKMLSLSTLMSSIFYGGLIVITSPIFTRVMFPSPLYPEYMNWAIGAMFLSLVHAIASMAKPTAMNTPPSVVALLSNALQSSSMGYTSDGLRNRATALRHKFKGSDTLLYNTVLMVLSSLAIISALCHYGYGWPSIVMLCGNVVVVSRVIPALIMETLTQKQESIPVLKMLIHVFIECCLIIIGVCGSLDGFDSGIGVAIVINIILVILQVFKLVKNPALRTALTNLSENENERADGRQLMNESHDGGETAPSEELESNGIYQPVA